MLVWPADNWDSPDTVGDIFAFFQHSFVVFMGMADVTSNCQCIT